MKSLMLAAGILSLGATVVLADDLGRQLREFKEGLFPYAREKHEQCQGLGHREWELRRDITNVDQRRAELEHQLADANHQRAEMAEKKEHAEHELREHCGGWRHDRD